MKTLRLLIVVGMCALAEAQPAAQRDSDWKAILPWLPEDTEALFVAPRPFRIPGPSNDDIPQPPVDGLREFALGRLTDFPALYEPLIGSTVSYAVAGVRGYHPAPGIGMMPYDGCALIEFAEPLPSHFAEVLARLSVTRQFGSSVSLLSTEWP